MSDGVMGPVSGAQLSRYITLPARVSGPLLDRIDLHLEVPALAYRQLSDERSGELVAAH